MNQPSVIALEEHRRRSRRVARAINARATLRAAGKDAPGPDDPRPGRAWINGRPVGGPEPAGGHLYETYD